MCVCTSIIIIILIVQWVVDGLEWRFLDYVHEKHFSIVTSERLNFYFSIIFRNTIKAFKIKAPISEILSKDRAAQLLSSAPLWSKG